MSRYKTIIFDFDGTIADTLEHARIVFNELADESTFRKVTAEEIPQLRELNLNGLLKTLGVSKWQVPGILAKGRKLLKERITEIPLVDGMKELIVELRGQVENMIILTSNSEENVATFLEFHALDREFDLIQSASKLAGKSKHIRKIFKSKEYHLKDSIYIGDEVRDVEACQKAGLSIVSVTWGFNAASVLAESEPSFLVSDVAELREVLLR